MKSIALFCGAACGTSPIYAASAQSLGRAVAEAGLTLVYGGGNVGLMGLAADAALAAGGQVVGVIPSFLKEREVAHLGLSRLHVTQTMHERKALMAELSDAFIALPGGLGTLDELFEIITWAQLSVHDKPVGLLDVDGFYQPLLDMVRHMDRQGFIRGPSASLFSVDDDVGRLLQGLMQRASRAVAGQPAFDRT